MELSQGQIQSLTKKRWLVLIASCLINLCAGSLYAWSVFAPPLAEHIGKIAGTILTSGSLAVGFTVANAVGPITIIGGGFINDSIGPRWVIFTGGLLFGGGFFLLSFATSVAAVCVTYGLLAGLGMGLIYGCTISNSVKFFPDKRGLAGGIATASYGLSSVIIPPVANALIQAVGIVSAIRYIGAAFAVIICLCSFFVIKSPKGFAPEGWTPKTPMAYARYNEEKDWKGMLASPIFYVMMFMLLTGAVAGLMTVSQASSLAKEIVGMTVTQATVSVSVLALFNAVGRVGAGFVSDRLGRINTLTAMLVLAMIGLTCLYFAGMGDTLLFYIGIALVGICFGSFMGVFPGFTADRFGDRNNSVNYGIMFIGFAAAGIAGPIIINRVHALSGSYKPAFLIASVLAMLGVMLSMLYRIIIREQNHKN